MIPADHYISTITTNQELTPSVIFYLTPKYQPLPTTTAGEEIGTTPGDIPLDVINDSSTSTPLETAADGVSTPQEEVEDELEETVLDAALPTYNKLNGKDVAPPDYESAVQMEVQKILSLRKLILSLFHLHLVVINEHLFSWNGEHLELKI